MTNLSSLVNSTPQIQDESRWVGLYGMLRFAQLRQQHGIPIPRDLAYRLVSECTKLQDLELARSVQSLIIQNGHNSIPSLSDHLVRVFSACGNLVEANQAFMKVGMPSNYTWNSIIDAYSKLGSADIVFHLYEKVCFNANSPDVFTFLSALKAFRNIDHIEQCRHLHADIYQTDIQYNIAVGTTLVYAYSKCGSLEEAGRVFERLTKRNVVSWCTMVAAYAEHGEGRLALHCFEDMKHEGIQPDKVTFLSTFKACGSIGSAEINRYVHEMIIGTGLECDIAVGTTLIDMYAKCGSLHEACRIFNMLPSQNVVSWNAMIAGYAYNGGNSFALGCFENMQQEGIRPDKISFLSILKTCDTTGRTRWIHEKIILAKLQHDVTVMSSLINVYATCGNLEEAYRTFGALPTLDVVPWNVMISGYASQGKGYLALDCFQSLQHKGIKPSKASFFSLLRSCINIGTISQSRWTHEQIIENGLESDIMLINALIDVYAKCGSLEDARITFEKLLNRSVVSWNAMITAYTQHDVAFQAMECYDTMQQEGTKPSKVTFLSILKACAGIGAMVKGRYTHAQILYERLEREPLLGNTLIDMYVKCGATDNAERVFNSLSNLDVVSWSVMISGYAQTGEVQFSVNCFNLMQYNNMAPDSNSFLGLLTAIGRAGLVDEGYWYFRTMIEFYDIRPTILHTTCMLDLVTHAGYFVEAKQLVEGAAESDACLWMTVLSGCRVHCNADFGRQIFDLILQLDPLCSAAYVLMSNIYFSAMIDKNTENFKKTYIWKRKILVN